MGLMIPDTGLTIWMLITFMIVLFLLTKYAWKPIMKAIKDREKSIEDALKSAENAKTEMNNLKAENEKILQAARNERDIMIKEAREIRESMIAEAKGKAKAEGEKLLQSAREAIQNEKMAAITDLKNQVAQLSIDIAEKIIARELSSENKQKELLGDLLKEVKLN
ncbi:MAG TPA: F0F1 ATP synthase subunit B [Bacteroidia bacterium]|nr:F0F1 ATP synthase subunit B [Bacteroidia bacterium]